MSYSYSKLNMYLDSLEKYSGIIDVIEDEKKDIKELIEEIESNYDSLFVKLGEYTTGSSGHLTQLYDSKVDIVRRKAARIYDDLIDTYERLCVSLDAAKSKKNYYAKKAEEEKKGLEEMEREAEQNSITKKTNTAIASARRSTLKITKGVTKDDLRI